MSSDHIGVPIQPEPNVPPPVETETENENNTTEMILYLANLAAFLIALGICIASFTIPSLQKAAPFGLSLWQWTLLITVLLCGPLLSKLFQYLVDCLADTEYSMKDNIIFYVVELANKTWVVLWFSLILVAWFWVVHQPSYLKIPVHNDRLKQKYTKIFDAITTTLTTILIGSFLWLVKDGILTRKKATFHIKRFFERVYRALIHQHLINKLLPTRDNVGGLCGFMSGKFCEEKMPMSLLKVKVNKKNVSNLGMKKVNLWFLKHPNFTYYDTTHKKNKTIASEKDARDAVAIIFRNEGPQGIRDVLKQYSRYFEDDETKDEASKLIRRLVPNSKNPVASNAKEIEVEDIEELMVKMFRYRSTLSRSLKGNMELFRSVNSVINGLLILFIFALWLIMLRVETRNIIFVIASAIAGSAFLIGDTCSKLLNCWFLIFVVHPYDIGDCCEINGIPVTIKSIGILATKVETLDNELKYYSNSKLFEELPIINYTRSDNLGEFVEFSPEDVTKEKTKEIENEIERYIRGNSAEHWDNHDYRFEKEFNGESKLKIKLHLKHTIKFHDFKERQRRKSELVQEIREILNGNNKGSDKAQPSEEEKQKERTGSWVVFQNK